MSRILSALVDLAAGVVFVLIAFASARVLLQDPRLVYLCFPLLVAAALAVGFWRGRKSRLPSVLIALLASTPLLVLALYFFSGRDKPFILFPAITFLCVCAGAAFARSRARLPAAAAVVVIAIVAGAFAGPPFVRLIVPGHNVNEAPIPFTIHLVDGAAVSSQSLRGEVVVLDFWATWCVPCQHELPAIQRVYQSMKGREDVAFFAIDGVMTDAPGDAADTAEKAARYFRRGGFTLPLSWDGGAVLERAFRPQGFPTLLVLDGAGRVRMRHSGFIGGENLEKTLSEAIAGLSSASSHPHRT